MKAAALLLIFSRCDAFARIARPPRTARYNVCNAVEDVDADVAALDGAATDADAASSVDADAAASVDADAATAVAPAQDAADAPDDAGALETEDPGPKLTSATWKVSLNVGREQGTWMPEEWAASGARLLLPVVCEFSAEPYPGEPEALVGRACFRVRPKGDATFVSVGGTTTVKVEGGAWAVQPPKRGRRPALLRFWLFFPEAATRNDVELPRGRVFFTAPVWQAPELERGEEEAAKAEAALREADERTQSALADDSANPIKNLWGLRGKVLALDEKRFAAQRLARIRKFTAGADDAAAGAFPGLAEGATLTVGGGGMVVKRRPRVGVGVEYHVLGKFTVSPVADAPTPATPTDTPTDAPTTAAPADAAGGEDPA